MKLEDAKALALALMTQHGLIDNRKLYNGVAFEFGWSPWTFAFNRAKNCYGLCQYGPRLISLSHYFVELNDEAEIKDTILHEIAHALAGKAAGHSWKWKQIARSIGAVPERCADAAMPDGAITGACACAVKHTMYRMPRRRYRCTTCKSPITWRRK